MNKIACIIMASGEGKRFGGNKLMADVAGKPMIGYILDATEELFEKRIVVTRHKEVADYCNERGVEYLLHDFPNRNDTVRLGMEAIFIKREAIESGLAQDYEGIRNVFFCVGDQPFLKKSSIEKMISVVRENPDCIVRAGYMDIVGSPVAFPRSMFEELMNLPEKKGGNYLVKKYEDIVRVVQVTDAEELMDIDYKEDLK